MHFYNILTVGQFSLSHFLLLLVIGWKLHFALYIKCYKIYLRLNHYTFRTVKGINFLFSTLNTTSFLYGKIHLGVLHLLRASIASFDTPPGSNPP